MKTIVYGVTHWDDEEQAKEQASDLHQWYNRVKTHIPNASEIFLTTGTYSPPQYNPLPCKLFQIPFFRPAPYNKQNCYFRLGFITGIWKALLDFPDFDLLIHCQCRHLLGESILEHLENFFYKRDELVMSINFTADNNTLYGMDVGFLVMKKPAALYYTIASKRNVCESSYECLNCEEEAYEMFKNNWYNPWPHIPTVKQIDLVYNSQTQINKDGFLECTVQQNNKSKTEIIDLEYYKKLPFIANGKHVSPSFYKSWLESHPV